MPAAQKDLLIKQGDSFEIFFRVRNKYWDPITESFVPGEYRDLTGLVGKGQIRTDLDNGRMLAEFEVVIPDQTVAETKGSVILKLTPTQTAALPRSVGYPTPTLIYDLELANTTNPVTFRKTYLEGGVSVKGQVTK